VAVAVALCKFQLVAMLSLELVVQAAVALVVNQTETQSQTLGRPTAQTTQVAVVVAVRGMEAFQTTPSVVAAVQVLL
jgi:hypothetical protein